MKSSELSVQSEREALEHRPTKRRHTVPLHQLRTDPSQQHCSELHHRVTSAYHSREESERFQVFQDVAVLGGNQHHVELLHGLVHVAHALCLHKGVLLPCVHQLWERC